MTHANQPPQISTATVSFGSSTPAPVDVELEKWLANLAENGLSYHRVEAVRHAITGHPDTVSWHAQQAKKSEARK